MKGLQPEENDTVLRELVRLQKEYRGRILVRSKCQPQLMRHVHELDPQSPLMSYSTRCPCGIQYCRITPDGKLTPCPYLPAEAGDLRKQSFAEIWNDSELFRQLRSGGLGGKCGDCEYRRVCGGCRARAYAQTGDYLEADPSCEYQPGRYGGQVVQFDNQTPFAAEPNFDLLWTQDARERLDRVPSFAKGMVIKSVERYAKENGSREVTPEMMKAVKENFFRTGIPSFKPKLN